MQLRALFTMRLPKALSAALLLAACRGPKLSVSEVLARDAPRRLAKVDSDDRREYLRRARIFDDVHVGQRDALSGPPDPQRFRFNQRVSCRFIEPRADDLPRLGTTPKFYCALAGSDRGRVKVKYGRTNPELYGELLGSRLLWLLGVASDADYAVRVRCRGCPADPWGAYLRFPLLDRSPRLTRNIDDALIQRLYPGLDIETRPDQGWSFDELGLIDEAVGGATRADVDALRLLAAFIAHGDDKPENQRLVCPFADVDLAGHCTRPRLLIADLGSTFGRGANRLSLIDRASRPSFAAWSSLAVWQDRARCRANLAARSSHSNPLISEAGRQRLAGRLAALSQTQIRDLFVNARLERLGETTRDRNGGIRPVKVEDWTEAFERRRAEIVGVRCP